MHSNNSAGIRNRVRYLVNYIHFYHLRFKNFFTFYPNQSKIERERERESKQIQISNNLIAEKSVEIDQLG